MKRTCGLLFLCAALTASLTACGNHTVRRDNDGTMTGSPGNGTASYDTSEPYNNGSVTDNNRDAAWNAGNTARDMLDDAGDDVRDAMDDAGDHARNAMDDAADTARDSVHNAQDAADQIEERAREALYGTGSVPNDQTNG